MQLMLIIMQNYCLRGITYFFKKSFIILENMDKILVQKLLLCILVLNDEFKKIPVYKYFKVKER